MALPVVIQEIVRLIGHSHAMALVHAFGGQELRIPKTEASDTWAALVEVIGEAATRKLAVGLGGGEPIYIALCARAVKADRNRRMIDRYDDLLRQGHSGRGAVSVLVREFAPISNRWVEQIVNAPVPEPTGLIIQPDLF
jgi:hypothetical protein